MNSSHSTVVQILVNGVHLKVRAGTSVAAALAQQAPGTTRMSVTGESRAPLCGMGVCHECRVRIDGRTLLACQTVCAEGMMIHTDVGTAPGSATP
ncbi:MAG: (2Fe-2S)-binding protein [Gammaproteobacteria bacterium]|jgi:D-hydroxyproline dehydrogenase subunit gamma|nr:(2Fe-2S)-binding protein [Gammaproteobacteria bacterium]MBU1352079.1 (2Fe-2S)-binding protein [Gammaproteobacteria bacterium]MBU1505761.1 (2Fe-2S)-binding protein [Gammaproteobacteria bacterium]MBU2119449.1 (2Fe-2S)-binding protein [Gammaproteobacteria bacterium]MBU2172645.1 (2Fe-2S)-binding protein [Gammaproteobacteria bacterium]